MAEVSATHFIGTILANVDNEQLDDKSFREFIRNTLPIVDKPHYDSFPDEDLQKKIMKYYK